MVTTVLMAAQFGGLIMAIILHEVAHGYAALKLGDPTAKERGRLTLNPIAHIDPFGSIILPLLLKLSGSGILIGWAKPVPVDFNRLGNPKRDMMLVAVAGPLTNIALAILAGVLCHMLHIVNIAVLGQLALGLVCVVNVVLAVFNMIPIPPLDGSRVVMGLLPREAAKAYAKLERYGFLILVVLLYTGFLRKEMWDTICAISTVLLPGPVADALLPN